MGKTKELILDECITNPNIKNDLIEIESMVNQEYLDNVQTVREIIERQQLKNQKAYERVKDMIVN